MPASSFATPTCRPSGTTHLKWRGEGVSLHKGGLAGKCAFAKQHIFMANRFGLSNRMAYFHWDQ